MFKFLVRHRLESYVRKYFKKRPEVKLVAVVGAAGKTTTKTAVATVLARKFNVQYNPGNLNEALAVPLGILGVDYPPSEALHSIGTWREVFRLCREQITNSPAEVVVAELGTDHPGEIPHFAKYLKPDVAVVTSIVPEHMEFFENLDNVAAEELALAPVAKKTFINVDDTDEKYLAALNPDVTEVYSTVDPEADYFMNSENGTPLDGYAGKIKLAASEVDVKIGLVGAHNLRAGVAAAAVGKMFGLTDAEIRDGLAELRPVAGRMNILKGIHDAIIVDDTYNSSPTAAVAALRTLYEIPADQRIAVLGNMNELGNLSEAGHKKVGEFLDGEYLEWVITEGEDANKYIAPLAEAAGINVAKTTDALAAGAEALKHIDPERRTAVLFKGSQNGVFLEEAVKMVIPENEYDKLVRQDAAWRKKKAELYEKNFAGADDENDG